MANPRKFSEKIALHNQKQAEETAAFEAILRDVSAATRGNQQPKPNQHLHIQHNLMHQYRGGSLPNVNQMATASNSGMDLQALQHMEGMRGGSQARVDRMHPRDRGRQIGPLRSRQFQMEKSRADCSPYGSGAYLSPPPDTSWRRTNSDSAIHSSLQSGGSAGDVQSPNTPPLHRRIQEVVGENSMSGDMLKGPYPWDPKKLQQRPKSCEVPNINIYPSTEQDSQVHIPISNNTGSLPDLTILQFPSPLTTPIDIEDQQNYGTSGASPANLSPTNAHHLNMGPPGMPNGSPAQSPGSQRRRVNTSGPSPLILQGNGTQSMRLPHSPPVSCIDPTRLPMDPLIRQQYILYMHQQQQRHGTPQGMGQGQGQGQFMTSPQGHQSPTHTTHNGTRVKLESPRVPPPHMGPVPQVCVTSHENDPPEPSLTQYRNNISEGGCQSPTSPHSQSSYSPSQSPGLPPQNTSWNKDMFDMDSYHVQQQQQQTNALQQQFEHFMVHDNQQQQQQQGGVNQVQGQCIVSNNNSTDTSNSSSAINQTTPTSTQLFSQAYNNGLSASQEFTHQQQQQQQQQQQGGQQQFYMDNNISTQSHFMLNSQTIQSMANNKIPDIVLSGEYNHQGLAGMSDSSFDADFFGSVSDEVLKDGLVPLDLDGLQMLTDPTMVADADTENSFRLDQL